MTPTQVSIFEHNNYGGRTQQLILGYNAGPLAIGNDVVSSVKVPPGYRVTLYEHAPGNGRVKVLTADTPSLPGFNDAQYAANAEGIGLRLERPET